MRSEISATSHRRRTGKLANELPEGGKAIFLDSLAQREKTETAKIVDRTIRKLDSERRADIS